MDVISKPRGGQASYRGRGMGEVIGDILLIIISVLGAAAAFAVNWILWRLLYRLLLKDRLQRYWTRS